MRNNVGNSQPKIEGIELVCNEQYFSSYPSKLTNVKYNPVNVSFSNTETSKQSVKLLYDNRKNALNYLCPTNTKVEHPIVGYTFVPEDIKLVTLKPIVVISLGRSQSIFSQLTQYPPVLAYDPRGLEKGRIIILLVHSSEYQEYIYRYQEYYNFLELHGIEAKGKLFLASRNLGGITGFGASRYCATRLVKQYMPLEKKFLFLDDDLMLNNNSHSSQYDTDDDSPSEENENRKKLRGLGAGATTRSPVVPYNRQQQEKLADIGGYNIKERLELRNDFQENRGVIQQGIEISVNAAEYDWRFVASGEDLALMYSLLNEPENEKVKVGISSGNLVKMEHFADNSAANNKLRNLNSTTLSKLYKLESEYRFSIDGREQTINGLLQPKPLDEAARHKTSSLIVERVLLTHLSNGGRSM